MAAPAEIVEPATTTRRTSTRRAQRALLSIGRGITRVLRRWAFALLLVVVFPALIAVTSRLYPDVLYAIVGPLPSIVGQPLRGGIDGMVAVMSPVRDGLSWIDVSDPQIRKTARLPAAKPASGR